MVRPSLRGRPILSALPWKASARTSSHGLTDTRKRMPSRSRGSIQTGRERSRWTGSSTCQLDLDGPHGVRCRSAGRWAGAKSRRVRIRSGSRAVKEAERGWGGPGEYPRWPRTVYPAGGLLLRLSVPDEEHMLSRARTWCETPRDSERDDQLCQRSRSWTDVDNSGRTRRT